MFTKETSDMSLLYIKPTDTDAVIFMAIKKLRDDA